MSDQKYPVGSVVKSVAGGPDMSVNKLMTSGLNDGQYRCQWFSGRKLESGFFYENELVLVVNDEDKEAAPRHPDQA